MAKIDAEPEQHPCPAHSASGGSSFSPIRLGTVACADCAASVLSQAALPRAMIVFARSVAWLIVGIVVFSTLVPIGLRPHLWSPNTERFVAFLLMAAILTVSYRRKFLVIAIFVIAVAVLLELAQLLVPSRDARVSDAAIKVAGGLIGAGLGKLVGVVSERFSLRDTPKP